MAREEEWNEAWESEIGWLAGKIGNARKSEGWGLPNWTVDYKLLQKQVQKLC